MLRVFMEGKQGAKIRDMLRPAHYVPEAKRVSELLREMQLREVHAVIVVDEYGGTAGLVTLEDIVEEIVGEIRDEYDQAEEMLYQQIDDNEYVFQGRIDIDDFNDILNTHLTREVADSLGGYIYGRIGRVPLEGEKIEVEDWELTVEQVSRRRIRIVRAKRMTGEPDTEDEKNNGEPGNER
jgi:putative hemolysin